MVKNIIETLEKEVKDLNKQYFEQTSISHFHKCFWRVSVCQDNKVVLIEEDNNTGFNQDGFDYIHYNYRLGDWLFRVECLRAKNNLWSPALKETFESFLN